MQPRHSVVLVSAVVVLLGARPAVAQGPEVSLSVAAGRPLRAVLEQRVRVTGVGQPVAATIVEPVYAFDRIVVPAGAIVRGRVDKLEPASKMARAGAMAGGDFTPLRSISLQFDLLVLPDGREIRISTRMKGAAERVAIKSAPPSEKSKAARARDAATKPVKDAANEFKHPDKMERLKDWAIHQLPYHPQYLNKGTVYTLELLEPLNFGTAASTEWAPAGTPAAPDAVLNARLVTRLDSSKTPRGTPIRAVVTEPVFSADHRLILPEGAELQGEVTFTKQAKRLRRNGQLRFLFSTIQLPSQAPEKLLASLASAQLSEKDHVAIDEEGGARVTNPKTRFIPPAVALYAFHAARDLDPIDAGEIGNAAPIPEANVGGRALGGFSGLGVLGVFVGQISRPVAGTLAFVGLAQSVYTNLLAKGREMVFPSDTSIQLQLSPASTKPSQGR